MEKFHKQENKKEKKSFSEKWKKILGIGVVAGIGIIGGDRVWDSYQETQRHKEREDQRKNKIELTDSILHENTRNFSIIKNTLEEQDEQDMGQEAEIVESVDSLAMLLKDLDEQKKVGDVHYETIVKIKSITKSLEERVTILPDRGEGLLPAINSVKENLNEISKAEQVKEISKSLDNLLSKLKDKEVLNSLSKHPRALERILESFEDYKVVFAENYVDQDGIENGAKSIIDSSWSGSMARDRRILYALTMMNKEGTLNDFFESLGPKINMAMIASRFDGKVSLSKNFCEFSRDEYKKILEEEKDEWLRGLSEQVGRQVSFDEMLESFHNASFLYLAEDFFGLFSSENSGNVERLIKKIERNKEINPETKEEIIKSIRDFGEDIREITIRLDKKDHEDKL